MDHRCAVATNVELTVNEHFVLKPEVEEQRRAALALLTMRESLSRTPVNSNDMSLDHVISTGFPRATHPSPPFLPVSTPHSEQPVCSGRAPYPGRCASRQPPTPASTPNSAPEYNYNSESNASAPLLAPCTTRPVSSPRPSFPRPHPLRQHPTHPPTPPNTTVLEIQSDCGSPFAASSATITLEGDTSSSDRCISSGDDFIPPGMLRLLSEFRDLHFQLESLHQAIQRILPAHMHGYLKRWTARQKAFEAARWECVEGTWI